MKYETYFLRILCPVIPCRCGEECWVTFGSVPEGAEPPSWSPCFLCLDLFGVLQHYQRLPCYYNCLNVVYRRKTNVSVAIMVGLLPFLVDAFFYRPQNQQNQQISRTALLVFQIGLSQLTAQLSLGFMELGFMGHPGSLAVCAASSAITLCPRYSLIGFWQGVSFCVLRFWMTG